MNRDILLFRRNNWLQNIECKRKRKKRGLKNSLDIIKVNSRVRGQEYSNSTGNRKGCAYFKMQSYY